MEELGWDNPTGPAVSVPIGNGSLNVEPIAQKRGFMIFVCDVSERGFLSPAERRAFERQLQGIAFEHVVIFNADATQQWMWASKEAGRPRVVRTFNVRSGAQNETLVQRLLALAFSLDEEDTLRAEDVSAHAQYAFDVEDITRRFFEEFKLEHRQFLSAISGIRRPSDREWYASIVLNRLMFMYFVQRKGFLAGDPAYLQNRFKRHRKERSSTTFFRSFFLDLCHEGLGNPTPSAAIRAKLGDIKYVNGGLFEMHRLEKIYGETLDVEDDAFESVFQFFAGWHWHLDVRANSQHNEINPDVLGYIFEKFVNQKQMGAFYTKEDVSQYVALNTILPALLHKMRLRFGKINRVASTISELFAENNQRYVISLGAPSAELRVTGDPQELAQPNVNGLQLLIDVIEEIDSLDSVLILFDELRSLRVLDPTCGSGAFLFAALNLLSELYDACLERISAAAQGALTHDQRLIVDRIIDDLRQHDNRNFYILKRIIVNNLYGVDIMEEAVEICKLRLFLKLVAQVDDVRHLEPLPNADFNIRAGNSLIGFASHDEIESATRRQHQLSLSLQTQIEEIDALIDNCARALKDFRASQLDANLNAEKFSRVVLTKLSETLSDRLDELLYGATKTRRSFESWRRESKPFHWYASFLDPVAHGGFDVIIGNPPFVDYSKVKKQYEISGYETGSTGNLYAMVLERALNLLKIDGQFGMIVPLSITFSRNFVSLRNLLNHQNGKIKFASFDNIPDRLFTGAKESNNTSKANQQRITIVLLDKSARRQFYGTALLRWKSKERERLFSELEYVDLTDECTPAGWPKIGSPKLLQFWNRYESLDSRLGELIDDRGDFQLVVPRTAGYYISAYPSALNRTKQMILRFRTKEDRDRAFILINSDVFFWRWRVTGDAFDVTMQSVKTCPLPELPAKATKRLAVQLESVLDECSVFKMYRGIAVPNVNFNKRLDVLYAIDEHIIKVVAPDLELTPQDFAWSKSNSCFTFEVARSDIAS